MKSIVNRAALAAAFALLSQPVAAVTQATTRAMANNTPPTSSSSMIERGGTVTAVDPNSKTLTVDGTNYAYPAGTVIIHPGDISNSAPPNQLQKGMQIRFSTVRDRPGRERVSEIWIIRGSDAKPKGR